MAMNNFVKLYQNLDSTTSTNSKVRHLVDYLTEVEPVDAAWAVYLFGDGKFKRPVSTAQMRKVTYDLADMPEWLFEDAYAKVGDLAETIALILDREYDTTLTDAPDGLSGWMESLAELREDDNEEQNKTLKQWYKALNLSETFVLNKLIMGGMRVGVSTGLIAKALAEISGLDETTIKFRLSGEWEPTAEAYRQLVDPESRESNPSRPYPYFLASPLDDKPDDKGSVENWIVEWKWDGMRGQFIKRQDDVFLWSRGQKLITDTFPEVSYHGADLPNGTVLDGEILAWENDRPMPFYKLQERIGRKTVPNKLKEEVPVKFFSYDILERNGADIRDQPIEKRREILESIDLPERFRLSDLVQANSWEEYSRKRNQARDRRVEGLMLKRKGSSYQTGRKRGDWWKWKVDPYTIDAVLIYAKAGHGKRADLYSDMTFGIWRDNEIVPIAKAYSGLTDEQLSDLDDWIKSNTLERYGPVRDVQPEHVFEIAFSGLAPSNRHKSGISLRFPRIKRWRKDKSPEDANTLEDVQSILNAYRS